MVTFDEYIKGILTQITESYQVMTDLDNKAGDLEIIKKNLLKINGLFQVIIKKIETENKTSDDYVNLLKSSKFYLENYDFEREIETMSTLYSEDPNRLKNIRLKILEALKDKKLMERVQALIQRL